MQDFCETVLSSRSQPACVSQLTSAQRTKLSTYCQDLQDVFSVFTNIQKLSQSHTPQFCISRVYELSKDSQAFDPELRSDMQLPTDAEIVAAIFCGLMD